jgi:uncharacterized membrane protein YfcA
MRDGRWSRRTFIAGGKGGAGGGELLIPTLVLLFGIDIKLAVSLALAVGRLKKAGRRR